MNKEKLITRTVKISSTYSILETSAEGIKEVKQVTVNAGEKVSVAENQKAVKLFDTKETYGVSIDDFMKIAHKCTAEELK